MSRIRPKKTTNPSTTNKSKMVTLRVPNELAESLPVENRTEWILDAIKMKLSGTKMASPSSSNQKSSPKIGTKYAEIVTPKGRFKTQAEAAQAHGCAKRTFSDWLRNPEKPEYFGVTLEGKIVGK